MILFLPSCCYPSADSISSLSCRESELISNINYLYSCGFSYNQMLVVDNGFRRPLVPKDVRLIHDQLLFSSSPHIGESLMTQRAADAIKPSSTILKLHSRCKLLNIRKLQNFILNNREFVFIRRNMFRFQRSTFDKCPFAETRLYLLDSISLKSIIDKVLPVIDESLPFERAFLSASYQVKSVRNKLITHCSFYPLFDGQSGHGTNYSSLSSRLKYHLHGLTYRFGF